MTMYLVAGGDGCDGVPGRGDISVRELGTLMMLGVRGPDDPLSPLCETERVGRGCKKVSSVIIKHMFNILVTSISVITQIKVIFTSIYILRQDQF